MVVFGRLTNPFQTPSVKRDASTIIFTDPQPLKWASLPVSTGLRALSLGSLETFQTVSRRPTTPALSGVVNRWLLQSDENGWPDFVS
jgi:hypothetical protein